MRHGTNLHRDAYESHSFDLNRLTLHALTQRTLGTVDHITGQLAAGDIDIITTGFTHDGGETVPMSTLEKRSIRLLELRPYGAQGTGSMGSS